MGLHVKVVIISLGKDYLLQRSIRISNPLLEKLKKLWEGRHDKNQLLSVYLVNIDLC